MSLLKPGINYKNHIFKQIWKLFFNFVLSEVRAVAWILIFHLGQKLYRYHLSQLLTSTDNKVIRYLPVRHNTYVHSVFRSRYILARAGLKVWLRLHLRWNRRNSEWYALRVFVRYNFQHWLRAAKKKQIFEKKWNFLVRKVVCRYKQINWSKVYFL